MGLKSFLKSALDAFVKTPLVARNSESTSPPSTDFSFCCINLTPTYATCANLDIPYYLIAEKTSGCSCLPSKVNFFTSRNPLPNVNPLWTSYPIGKFCECVVPGFGSSTFGFIIGCANGVFALAIDCTFGANPIFYPITIVTEQPFLATVSGVFNSVNGPCSFTYKITSVASRPLETIPEKLFINLPGCLGQNLSPISIPLTEIQPGLWRSITSADTPGNPVPDTCNGNPVGVDGQSPIYFCNYAYTFTVRHGVNGIGDCVLGGTIAIIGTERPSAPIFCNSFFATPIELLIGENCGCVGNINFFFNTCGQSGVCCETICCPGSLFPTRSVPTSVPICTASFCDYLTGDITLTEFDDFGNCSTTQRIFTYGRFRHNHFTGFPNYIYVDALGGQGYTGFLAGTVISCDPIQISYILPANIYFNPADIGPLENMIPSNCTSFDRILLTETALFPDITCPSAPQPPPKYKCQSGKCVQDALGIYNTLALCVAGCAPLPKYLCNGQGICIEDANGTFTDITICQATCPIPPVKYKCLNDSCVQASDGQMDQQTCLSTCGPPLGDSGDGDGGRVTNRCCPNQDLPLAIGIMVTNNFNCPCLQFLGVLNWQNAFKAWFLSTYQCNTYVTYALFCSEGPIYTFVVICNGVEILRQTLEIGLPCNPVSLALSGTITKPNSCCLGSINITLAGSNSGGNGA